MGAIEFPEAVAAFALLADSLEDEAEQMLKWADAMREKSDAISGSFVGQSWASEGQSRAVFSGFKRYSEKQLRTLALSRNPPNQASSGSTKGGGGEI